MFTLLAEKQNINDYGPQFIQFAIKYVSQLMRKLTHEMSVDGEKFLNCVDRI